MNRSSRMISAVLTVVAIGLCVPTPEVAAQSKTRVSGTIKDLEGNPIAGATIAIRNDSADRDWTAESKKDGKWAAILEGKVWKFTVKAKGFLTYEEERTVESLGRKPTLNFQLAPGDDSAVAAAAPVGQPGQPAAPEGTPVPKIDLADLKAGDALFDQGKYQEALASYEIALTKNPTLIAIYVPIGDTYAKMENWEKAIENYGKIPEGDKYYERTLVGTANAYLRLKQSAKAVEAYKKVLATNAANPDANFILGQIIFNEQNDAAGALPYLEAAVTAKPDWVPAQVKLGYVYVNLGDNAKAKAAFEKALALDPSNAEAKSMMEMFK